MQKSVEIHANYTFLTKFVQESKILQVCYNVEHFSKEASDNIFTKFASIQIKNLQILRASCKS